MLRAALSSPWTRVRIEIMDWQVDSQEIVTLRMSSTVTNNKWTHHGTVEQFHKSVVTTV